MKLVELIPPSTTKPEDKPTPPPPPLTPIQVLNEKIAAKRREAQARLDQIRRERAAHEKTWPPVIPANAGPAEAAQLETSWQDERDRLRRAERGFSEVAILMELDDAPASKPMLTKALAYLKDKVARVQEQAKAALTATPKKSGLVAMIENTLGAPAEPEPAFPPPHAPPVGGLFGVEVLPPLGDELAALEAQVKAFPDTLPFYKVADLVNQLDSRLYRAAPPPPMAVRQDKGWQVPSHM
jgi:hypothetical protein